MIMILTWPGNSKPPFSCPVKIKEDLPDNLRVRTRWKGPSSCSGYHRASPGSWKPPLPSPLICSSAHTFGPLRQKKRPKKTKPRGSDESQSLTSAWLCGRGGSSQLTIRVLIGDPGVLDVVVVLVAPLNALLSPEVLVGAGALLRVAHLIVEGRAGTTSTPVGRPERWTDSKRKYSHSRK